MTAYRAFRSVFNNFYIKPVPNSCIFRQLAPKLSGNYEYLLNASYEDKFIQYYKMINVS